MFVLDIYPILHSPSTLYALPSERKCSQYDYHLSSVEIRSKFSAPIAHRTKAHDQSAAVRHTCWALHSTCGPGAARCRRWERGQHQAPSHCKAGFLAQKCSQHQAQRPSAELPVLGIPEAVSTVSSTVSFCSMSWRIIARSLILSPFFFLSQSNPSESVNHLISLNISLF